MIMIWTVSFGGVKAATAAPTREKAIENGIDIFGLVEDSDKKALKCWLSEVT